MSHSTGRSALSLFGLRGHPPTDPKRRAARVGQRAGMSPDAMRRPTVRRSRETRSVIIREELGRLVAVEERHRRLLARLLIAVGLTVAVAVAGSVLIYVFENGKKGGDIHGFGDAIFFTLVQLLTVSSSLKNPVTSAGKVVDVILEAWAIFVVTAVAGSFASFFTSGDSS